MPAAGALLSVAVVMAGASWAGAASSPRTPGGAASGSVASISGASMEVQDPSTGQTTVNWTSTTTFSETASETLSAVSLGECLTVIGTPVKKSKTAVSARTITISQPASGAKCASGAAGGFGAGRSGAPGAGFPRTGGPPTGAGGFGGGEGGGTGRPAGAGRGSFATGNVAIASGQVTAVKGSTITLSGIVLSQFGRPAAATNSKSKKAPKKPATPKPQKLKITVAKSTTLSQTQPTAASSLAVGDCVSAFGQTSTTGAVTASTVRITSTGSKTCSAGFGAGGFGGRFGGGPGGPGGAGG